MKKIEDIRRDNLRRIRNDVGSVQELAEKIGKSQSQVSQWLNASAHSASGKPRTISSASCREIEKALRLQDGWMDVEHDAPAVSVAEAGDASALKKMISDASSEARLLAVYRLANAEQREVIDGAVRMVIDQLDIVSLLHGTK